MSPKVIRILWVLYFLCLIPALVTLYHRHQFDTGFNSVALVADYVQLLQLAQTENIDVDDLLMRVRDEGGVERIALLEDTPEFLAQRGLCTIVEGVGWPGWLTTQERDEIERNRGREPDVAEPPSTDWPLLMGLRHDMTHLIFQDTEVFERIATSADMRYPGLVEWEYLEDGGGIVSLAGEPKIVLEWGMGFDPELVEHLRGMGFELYPRLRAYPRLRNYTGYSPEIAKLIMAETIPFFPNGWLIFDGDSVMPVGGSFVVKLRTEEAELAGVGWIEFAEQRSAQIVAKYSPTRTARVHSIENEEMEVLASNYFRAITRFTRAVRERSVRIVYLKPFLLDVDSVNRIDKTIKMFSGVRESLEGAGFRIGDPSRISEILYSSMFTRIAGMLAIVIGVLLLLDVLGISVNYRASALILFLVIVTAGAGIKLTSLCLSLVSPTLAIIWLIKSFNPNGNQDGKALFWSVLGSWLGAVCITLTGALLIAASMINTNTLLAIDTFSGVKLALYLPILLAILLGLQIIVPEDKRSIKGITEWLLSMPIRIWHVLLGMVALVGLFIMIDRSGNFPILNVANWENDIRGWFEQLLYARPRTKEFLIGHPAMIVGIYLGLSRLPWRKPLMYAGIVIGSIALTSMTNTFCHLHTPIILSVFRTLAGIVIGGIVGIILSWVILGVCGKVWKTAKGGIED